MNASFLSVCGSQRDKDKIVAYRSGNTSQTAKEPGKEQPYSALKIFLWVFSATILRQLTSARNYATIADPKKQIWKGYHDIDMFLKRHFHHSSCRILRTFLKSIKSFQFILTFVLPPAILPARRYRHGAD